MFSLIRDVLMPAAPALLLIGALVLAPFAEAQENQGGETMAADAPAQLARKAITGVDVVPAGARLETGAADDARHAPRCRRVERIGKFTVRRCR